MVKSIKYKVLWKVWEYGYTEKREPRQMTVKLFEEPNEAGRYCIKGDYGGVEMLLLPRR